jgi:hypothetical protein
MRSMELVVSPVVRLKEAPRPEKPVVKHSRSIKATVVTGARQVLLRHLSFPPFYISRGRVCQLLTALYVL